MSQSQLDLLEMDLQEIASGEKAKHSLRFFKTGPGEYGEGDRFLGINVPDIRKLVRKYQDLTFAEIRQLLISNFHEKRLLGLLILVRQFQSKKSSQEERDKIYRFYLKHLKAVNNWDLVDLTAANIIGATLYHGDRSLLYEFAAADNLWKKRISIISTFYFIRNNDFSDTLNLAAILLYDDHDLIHKAVGWMLREVGNRDRKTEEHFLKQHYNKMPRTMLRYAIEKLPEKRRQEYLMGVV